MSEFKLDAFLRDNPGLLGEGDYKNYLYRRDRVDLPKLRFLEDVGLNPKEVLGEGDFKNYMLWRDRTLP